MTPDQSSLLTRLRSMDDQAEFAAADWIEELLDEVAALRAVVRECITAMPERIGCTWCGGDGYEECTDPIQGCSSRCTGEICPCTGCHGKGYDQWVW